MNKLVPIFIAFLHDLADTNGHYSVLSMKYIGALKEAFPADHDKVIKDRRDAWQRNQADLEAIAAGSPEQRAKVLKARIQAAEAELAMLEPKKEDS